MYKVIGEKNPTYLLADPQGADLIAIPCRPGNGNIERGTVMYRTANGLYAPAENAQMDGTYSLVVLDESVDTDANMAVAEDARAYRAGTLIADKVTLKNGGALTAAHALVLRQQGIKLNITESAGEFDNERRTITYKANNGAEPAQADVVNYAEAGAAYTVLANTVTGFTAPASKSFSKWNTKADGTGTDYAAAASYTADESLVLYAVWA